MVTRHGPKALAQVIGTFHDHKTWSQVMVLSYINVLRYRYRHRYRYRYTYSNVPSHPSNLPHIYKSQVTITTTCMVIGIAKVIVIVIVIAIVTSHNHKLWSQGMVPRHWHKSLALIMVTSHGHKSHQLS